MSVAQAKKLINKKNIKGGMIPKVNAAIAAVENGVDSVHIIDGSLEHSVLLEVLTDHGIGTMITKDYVEEK